MRTFTFIGPFSFPCSTKFTTSEEKKVKFFNLGPNNDWNKLLDKKFRNKIEQYFKKEMIELGYI